MAGGMIEIDFSSFSGLVKALGVIPAEMKAALRPAALKAGGIVADQAKINAAYSEDIPAAIYVKAPLSTRASVVVGADVKKAPQAKVLELGNTGRGDGKFRHPVFGTATWVSQDTQPYLIPALDAKRSEAVAVFAAAVREVAARHGLV